MPPNPQDKIEHARRASADELSALVLEADEAVLLSILDNPEFQEKHAEKLLDRADLSSNVLGAIGGTERWMASESIRLRLAKHPRTPKRVALSALRQLFLFDLVRVSLLPSVPGDVRRAAEETILVRVPHLPVGEKLTLARRGPARVAGAILAEGQPQAIAVALANAFLTESQVLKVLAKQGVPPRVVAAIVAHPKWSCLYNVRAALVRHPDAPQAFVQASLRDLTFGDLEDISQIRELAAETKQWIAAELQRRSGNGEAQDRPDEDPR